MAAATAIIGTALAVGGSAMNFAQAAKQGRLQEEAERDAEKAMAAARAKLEENFYEGLDINLKSFEQERDALAGVGQQLVQAGQEADRGAAATAGRVMLGMQQGEQDITNRQIDALEKLEQTVAAEESRLATAKATLDLGEAEGAQIAASDAAKNRAAAISGGVQGLASAGLGLMQSAELYGSKGARQAKAADRAQRINLGTYENYKAQGGTLDQAGFEAIGGRLKGATVFDSLSGAPQNIFKGVQGLFGGGSSNVNSSGGGFIDMTTGSI